MPQPRLLSAVLAGLLTLAFAAPAAAQVCMGLPTDPGQMSIQADVASSAGTSTFGGRLAMNFNTEYSLDLGLQRPQFDYGTGLVVGGAIGFEMEEYRPPICFTLGVRHERAPNPDGTDSGTTMIPIGMGIGKRLGSARALSLSLFVRPEYILVANPGPAGEFDSFWDELGERSEGRGIIGLLLATPFLYTTGSIEIATRNDFEPIISIGLGVIF